jgi:hypothetical protein
MERVLAQRYTAGVVAAFCRKNQVDAAALPQLVGDVLATWLRLDLPIEVPAPRPVVTKAKRGRPAQHRKSTPSRRPRVAAVMDSPAASEVTTSPEPDESATEQAAPMLQQMPEPEPEPVVASEPEPAPAPPATAEEALPDRDSPEMKRHTVESVFGNFRPARQDDTGPAQDNPPETEPDSPRSRRIPFSQQSVRRLRS